MRNHENLVDALIKRCSGTPQKEGKKEVSRRVGKREVLFHYSAKKGEGKKHSAGGKEIYFKGFRKSMLIWNEEARGPPGVAN